MSDATRTERTTIESLGESPMTLVAGGIALGVLIGMLLPRLAKEREVLEPLGKKLAGTATAAAKAARDAGQAEIESLLPDKGRDQGQGRQADRFGPRGRQGRSGQGRLTPRRLVGT